MNSPQSSWDLALLYGFTFQMSGHGLPVCLSMMLGDPAYAREQLRLACTRDDRELQQLALEMLSSLADMAPSLANRAKWSH